MMSEETSPHEIGDIKDAIPDLITKGGIDEERAHTMRSGSASALNSATHFNPELVTEPLKSAIPLNRKLSHSQGHALTFPPVSLNSSNKSSRKPSVSGSSGDLTPTNSHKAALSPKLLVGAPSRSSSNSLTSSKLFALNQSSDMNAPQLSTHATSNIQSSTSIQANSGFPNTMIDSYFPQPSVSTLNTASISPTQSSPSVRSLNSSATSTLKSHKPLEKQYVLNEQLYLNSMKNKTVDEYYTLGITSSNNDDELDEKDNEDLFYGLDKLGLNHGSSIFGNNRSTLADKGVHSIDDDELVLMSFKHLIDSMKWLKSVPPFSSSEEDPFESLKRSNSAHSISSDSIYSYLESQLTLERLSDHPLVRERLEWQTMLTSVLKGDIVRSEKSKLESRKHDEILLDHSDLIWLELKAWLNGRTVEDQKSSLEYSKRTADALFEEIMSFQHDSTESHEVALEKVKILLEKYYKVTSYWKNFQDMNVEKPVTRSQIFNRRIDAMNSFMNSCEGLQYEVDGLQKWTQNEALDVKFTKDSLDMEGIFKNDRSFAEQILKEKDIEAIFQKKIFFKHAPWMYKSKLVFMEQRSSIEEMNLPLPVSNLSALLTFPLSLIEEIISIRLEYARKLKKPTMMMIDQMIDDFSTYIKLSVQIKHTVKEYSQGWNLNVAVKDSFDKQVVEAIEFLFKLLHLKLIDSSKKSFRTFKEPDVMFAHWELLKNVGCFINGASFVVAEGFVSLTLRLLNRLQLYILEKQYNVGELKTLEQAKKWMFTVIDNVGAFKRKTNRFSNVLMKAFQNSVYYEINNHSQLLETLKASNHFLIYTGGIVEENGIYLIASEELLGCSDEEILDVLNCSHIGSDLIPKVEIKNSLAIYNPSSDLSLADTVFVQEVGRDGLSYYHLKQDTTQKPTGRSTAAGLQPNDKAQELSQLKSKLKSLGYILVFCPSEPMVWSGDVYNLTRSEPLSMLELKVDVAADTLVLLNQGSSYGLEYQIDRLYHCVGQSISFREKKCTLIGVENNLQKINKAYYRMTYIVLSNFGVLHRNVTSNFRDRTFFNMGYIFARDFAKSFLFLNVATHQTKSVIIQLMVQLSIEWLAFLLEECDPSHAETFRWCVPAMEFAMQMTNGWNILGLDEKQFKVLKEYISNCMSLLISHFDITDARSREAERINAQQGRPNIDIDDADNDMILEVNSEMRINAIVDMEKEVLKMRHYAVGKVIDETDNQNKFLKSLASSISNVSIRWQKRGFIGGGSFGNVYSAINLDTGDVLAVKEIKIQDSKTMKQVFPQIREEMRVMEILNHPNIVQYYGVEVHRDKVNIFMEFCEGSSLANLLEHGRIEDEMVTQVYTLQLLEGLTCLHQSGVVHRDIKPENILLDRNGIIKYVDFGAAKLIAGNGSKQIGTGSIKSAKAGGMDMIGTPMYMAPEAITGQGHGNFGSDDIWSLGCVVLEMVTGRRPWANLDNEWAIMYHVAAGHLPPFPSKNEISSAGRKFLSRCLIQDANKRASAMELLLDPWITQIRNVAFGGSSEARSTENRM